MIGDHFRRGQRAVYCGRVVAVHDSYPATGLAWFVIVFSRRMGYMTLLSTDRDLHVTGQCRLADRRRR